MTTIIISNEEIKEIVKIVKALEESDLLIKGVSETIEDGANGRFLCMILVTLAASLLGNLFACEGVIRFTEGTIIAGQDF